MSKRAVLYARVSGDDRKYATSGIDSQLADCRKYAESKNYRIVGEYNEERDKQTSGANWLPELQKVLKLAHEGGYDVLVVRELDRLARNKFKQLSIEIDLQALGITVEYVIGQFEDTAEGRLLKGLMSEFAEFEREKTLERTKRGCIRAVAAGNVILGGSNAPFGYDVVEIDGKRVLVINEREAEIVRLIFDLYAYEGKALLSICRHLKERNIPTPTKGKNHKARRSREGWSTGTMSGILNNETYVGRWYYRKTKNIRGRDGKPKQVARPRSEWLLVEVPSIIDEKTFNLVQQQRKRNKRQREKKGHYNYPLGGIMKCGRCGSGMVGVTRPYKGIPHRYYRCSTKHLSSRYERTCDMPSLRTDVIDPIIWQWVKEILLNPQKLHEAWKLHEQQQLNELQPLVNMIETNKHKLEELQAEKKRLIKAYTAGALTLDEISEEKTRIDKQIGNIEQAIDELQADVQPRIPDEHEIETIERYAQQIREGADLASTDPADQRKIYKMIQMEINLTYEPAAREGEAGQHWAEFRCILGQDRLPTAFNTNHQSGIGSASATAGAPGFFAGTAAGAESLRRAKSLESSAAIAFSFCSVYPEYGRKTTHTPHSPTIFFTQFMRRPPPELITMETGARYVYP